MAIKFDDIEQAFFFVSAMPHFTNSAYLNKETGEIYYESEYGDSDELPEDIDDDKYIGIPHKNDLDLGKKLVMEFIAQHLPEDLNEVYEIFQRKGAYSRYKDLLEKRGFLEEWYNYENQQTESTLRSWCAENDIKLTD